MTQTSSSEIPQHQQTSIQQPKQSASQPPIQKKKNAQGLWRALFLFITIGSTIFFQRVYQYQTQQYFASIRKGCLTTLLSISIPFAIFFMMADYLSHKYLDSLCQKYYISHQKYPTQQARKKRSYSIVRWGFSSLYYAFTSIYGYLILLPTSYMPPQLGGNGDCTDNIRYVNSFQEATLAMEIYYCIQFGKHFGRFFQHVFIRPQGNFYEFTLHHSISAFLIFFSYMMNFWMVGIFILFIHDISDCLFTVGRAYKDCRVINKLLLTIIIGSAVVNWIFCRIFLLSYCALFPTIKNVYTVTYYPQLVDQKILDIVYLPSVLMGVMIGSLQIMQLFWTYHIISTAIQQVISQKIARNNYD